MQIAALTDGQTLLLFAIEKLIVIETDQKYSMAVNDLCWWIQNVPEMKYFSRWIFSDG